MTPRTRDMLPGVALALAACGHSAPTTLHGLPATPARAIASYAGPPVRVDAVRLPPAIDRIEMLRETGAGRYVVLEFDRWAAPPGRLARAALTEDLAIRLPAGAVVATASADGPPVTAITVDVLSFSTAGTAVLTADWTRGCRPGGAPEHRAVRLETSAAADMPDALAALLGQLADRIAADLAAAPGTCPPAR